MAQLKSVIGKFYDEYQNNTPKKLKLVDGYLTYVLMTGLLQFAYCCLVGTFPFNSFLSGFISTVSCFVLGGNIFFFKYFNFLNSYLIFQYVFVSSQIHKTNHNSLAFRRNEDLLISYLPTLSFTW